MFKEKPTFEEAVALLADNPTPTFLATHFAIFHAGLQDLAARVANLEHGQLEATFKTAALESTSNAAVAKLNSVEGEHTSNKKRLDAMEARPIADGKKLDAIETRVRTVEGAVGSAGYKTALAQPIDHSHDPAPKTGFAPFTHQPAEPTHISPLNGEQGGPSQNPSHAVGV